MRRRRRDREFTREIACMIQIDGAPYCIDPAGGLLALLGKKWTLPLIGVLGNRSLSRFSELRDALPGIGSKSLAERLRELRSLGLIEREAFLEVPLRTEYRLTDAGASLRRALVPLLSWAGSFSPGDIPSRSRPVELPGTSPPRTPSRSTRTT
jgi:DNA-binding HxlR family transcriptional regulator